MISRIPVPTWLSPTQIHILTISEKHSEYANEVAQLLRDNDVRVEVDSGDDTIGKKIRSHRKMQPAYMVILGEGEIESRTVSLRARNGDQISGLGLEDFVTSLKSEIDNKASEPSLIPAKQD